MAFARASTNSGDPGSGFDELVCGAAISLPKAESVFRSCITVAYTPIAKNTQTYQGADAITSID
jgi:hypothetical protein